MKTIKTLALTALLASVAIVPFTGANAENWDKKSANETGAVTSQTFQSLDTDKSGALSESEFNAYTSASVEFDEADANSDGRITLSELQTAPADKKDNSSMN